MPDTRSYEISTNDVVSPVVIAEKHQQGWSVGRLMGTAFYINDDGFFLTVGHVLRAAIDGAKQDYEHPSLLRRQKNTGEYKVGILDRYEFSPKPHDIAIGKIHGETKSYYELANPGTDLVWKNVHAIGYPDSTFIEVKGSKIISPRKLTGQVTRFLMEDEPRFDCANSDFELSYRIPYKMSGSPLFIFDTSADEVLNDKFISLIGICVGNLESEILAHESIEIDDKDGLHKERRLKIEEYGIAHNLWEIRDWEPEILDGLTLMDAINGEKELVRSQVSVRRYHL